MKSWCHPGGLMFALGGAVIVHVFPAQENAGNIVRAPIAFPWVLETAERTSGWVIEWLAWLAWGEGKGKGERKGTYQR